MSSACCSLSRSITQKGISSDAGFRVKSGERGISSEPWWEFRPWLALVLLLATSVGWAVDYPIVYDANGGTGTIANGVKIQGVNATLSDGTGFTRPGYTFAGWEITSEGCVAAWGNKAESGTIPSGLTEVTAIAAGYSHTVALKQDGTVVAWGSNLYGQTTIPSGLTGVTAIAAGVDNTVALKQDGTVVAWGDNYSNQTMPSGLTGVTAIAAGWWHTVALKQDGTVVAWGDNSHGQTTIPNGLTGVTAIAAGVYHTVALKQDGTVVAWGDNSDGQTTIPSGLTGVTGISANYYQTVALKQDGTVVAWGSNDHGETTVPIGLTGVKVISAGANHTVALKQDGTMVAWGDNRYGQTEIPSGLTGVTGISAGEWHTVAYGPSYGPGGTYTMNGPITLYARWVISTPVTYDANGARGTVAVGIKIRGVDLTLADGSELTRTGFTFVGWNTSIDGTGTAYSGGGEYSKDATVTLYAQWKVITYNLIYNANGGTGSIANSVKIHGVNATLSDGAGFTRQGYTFAGWSPTATGRVVVAWGDNSFGQTTIPSDLTGVTAITAGTNLTVALKQDGTVVAWGANGNDIPSGLTGVKAIAVGGTHTVALKQDGTVVAWGSNSYGQTTIPSGLTGVTAIAAGYDHTVALKQDGTVVAWGSNAYSKASIPSGLTGVTAIAAVELFSVALKQDGTVLAWGLGDNGRTTIPSGLTGVKAIAAGHYHTLALKQDGTVVAWGDNGQGQTTIPSGLTGVTAIATAGEHNVALKQDGTVVAWGYNNFGQTTIPSGLAGVTAIAAGENHTVAYGTFSFVPGGTYSQDAPATFYAQWTLTADPVESFVTRFYQQCLGRSPDAGGLSAWTTALKTNGQSGADVARGFVMSPEFTNRNLSNDAFLNVLYTAFFNRAPDAGGLAVWQAELAKGVLREDVLYGFINAQEFTNLCTSFGITQNSAAGQQRYQIRQFVRRNYQQYLGREPDAGGKAGWMTYLSQGHTRAEVLDGFMRAQEFINLCGRYNILPFRMNG